MTDKYFRKNPGYEYHNIGSIVEHARGLVDKNLKMVISKEDEEEIKLKSKNSKGLLGNLVEEYYFDLIPNNRPEPDIVDCNLEIKTTGLKEVSGRLVAKERLKLGKITYSSIINEDWETSSLLKKNNHLLLLLYLYIKGVNVLELLFKRVEIFNFGTISQKDKIIIKKDWETIVGKIKQGLAHELSEGDTNYLGACTSGQNKASMAKQPCSLKLAHQRSFALKQAYINHLLYPDDGHYEEVTNINDLKTRGLEATVIEHFKPFIGKSVNQILTILNLKNDLDPNAKNYYSCLTKAMLGVSPDNEIDEFAKGDIQIKTIRIAMNNRPRESMSFKAFKFIEVIKGEWEDSDFYNDLSKKFLIIIYKVNTDLSYYLAKVSFWNMPFSDIQEAQKVWDKTVWCINTGNVDKLPKISENRVAHVRPHARNSKDIDITPNGIKITKQGFWINSRYIYENLTRDAL